MNVPRAVTASSDPERTMPRSETARLDAIHRALASLREEQRRLEHLGLEVPLARCLQQRRYWEFLEALFSVSTSSRPAGVRPRGFSPSRRRGTRP